MSDRAGATAHEPDSGPRGVMWARRHWAALAVAAYGVVLFLLKPATPFEWDEVLFQRALDRYDVASHSPHPPGYPAYVAAAKLVSWLVRDHLLALQIVAMAAAMLTLALVVRFARKLGAPESAAGLAMALLAVTPAFAFNANVGLSDVAGTAMACAAVLALFNSLDRERALPLGAALSALAVAVRPQLVIAIAPLGVAALIVTARARRWRPLILAIVAGVAVSAVCWLPAILITGADRFFGSARDMREYVLTAERRLRLPKASPVEIAKFWLGRPFGPWPAAVVFWALVVAGARTWWLRGRRTLVRVAGTTAAAYVLGAMFTLNMTTAVRYVLPALPFLGLLVCGVVAADGRRARRLGVGAALVWIVAVVGWAGPVYALRRANAPVWSALAWVREHVVAGKTTVVYDGEIEPHVGFLLGGVGLELVKAEWATPYGRGVRPDGDVLLVFNRQAPGTEVLFAQRWESETLRRLTRRRYDGCTVMRAAAAGTPVFSPDWRVHDADWKLYSTGIIALDDGAAPRRVRIGGADTALTVRRAAFPGRTIRRGETLDIVLFPGRSWEIAVTAPPNRYTRLAPVDTVPLASEAAAKVLADTYVIPAAAHTEGVSGSEWRTDLKLFNPQPASLDVTVRFLASGSANEAAPAFTVALPAGRLVTLVDVLARPEFAARAGKGALVCAAEPSGAAMGAGRPFCLVARTYNRRASVTGEQPGEGLPGLAPGWGLRAGEEATIRHVTNDNEFRGSVGMASLSGGWTVTRVTVRDPGGQVLGARDERIPPFGHVQFRLPPAARDASVSVTVTNARPEGRVFVYASMVAEKTGVPTHLLPDEIDERPLAAQPPVPLPRRLEIAKTAKASRR